jgi:hypothetical protein
VILWACGVGVLCSRKDAEHEITPLLVWFRARHVVGGRKDADCMSFCVQRVWKAFVEKVDEEEILLVTLTVNEVNKNKNVM